MQAEIELNPAIEIRPVNSKKMLERFIRVPWSIYRDDPNWVPPLLMERRDALSQKQAFFEHARWQAWIAYRDGVAVGRISAQIDDLYLQQHNVRNGFFGLIEAVDDAEIFKALFASAENWLREAGMESVIGPFNLNINQEIGLLTEGFDTPPYIMTGHAPRYYAAAIEACGYQPVQNMLAYHLTAATLTLPRVMQSLLKRNAKRIGMRSLDRSNTEAELESMRQIFNDAWEHNWNFTPFTQKEFKAVGKELLMIVPRDFIKIATLDGEDVAFIVLLPNINEVIANLNGRLLPFGWAKLLWRLKVRFPKSARVPLMGVKKQYQNTHFGPALAYLTIQGVIEAGLEKGIEKVEMSWILEQNQGVRHIIESVGGEISKRYSMYEKALETAE